MKFKYRLVFLFVFILLVAGMSAAWLNRKEQGLVFFHKDIVGHVHKPAINPLLRHADSLKYARQYEQAAQAYQKIVQDGRLDPGLLRYVQNQWAYVCLYLRRDSTAEAILAEIGKNFRDSAAQTADRADYNLNRGLLAYYGNKGAASLYFFEKARRLYAEHPAYGVSHLRYAECYSYLALAHFDFTRYNDTLYTLIPRAYRLYTDNAVLRPYRRNAELAMAFLKRMERNLKAGMMHCDSAEMLAGTEARQDTAFLIRCLALRAHLLKKSGQTESCIQLLDRTFAAYGHTGDLRLQELYKYYALAYIDLKDKSAFQENMRRLQAVLHKKPGLLVNPDFLWGYYCLHLQDYPNALRHFQLVLKNTDPGSPNYSFLREETLFCMARAYKAMGVYEKALNSHLRIFRDENRDDPISWEQLRDPAIYSRLRNQFVLLNEVADIFYTRYKNEGQMQDLETANQFWGLTDSLFYPEVINTGDEGLLFYQKEVGDNLYPSALEAAHSLYAAGSRQHAVNLAFRYCERQKSYLMFRDMQFDPKKFVKADPAVVEKLQDHLAKRNMEAGRQNTNGRSDADLIGLDLAIEDFYHRLKDADPVSFNLAINQNLPDVDEIQKSLKPNQVLVNYNVGKEKMHLLYIGRDTTFFHQTDSVEVIKKHAKRYKSALDGTLQHGTAKAHFTTSSRVLYQYLIKPFEGLWDKTRTPEIIVIPDRFLHEIPFEAFISSDKAPRYYRYFDFLIHKAVITYTPSWKIWHIQKPFELPPNPVLSYFTYGNKTAAGALKGAGSELSGIRNTFSRNIRIFEGTGCNPGNFIRQAQQSNIVHAYLHGESSISNRYDNKLFFKLGANPSGQMSLGDTLYAHDLATARMKVALAVLTACKTNVGDTGDGEGAFTLTRSFLQAGCSHVVSSLWSVEDVATQQIVGGFYKALAAGLSPAAALREAKLEYLKQVTPGYDGPRFWAGMICFN
jgi:CHAT domain-containing protein